MEQWKPAIDVAMKQTMRPADFDLVTGDDGSLEITTDSWTLHLESGENGVAWIAMDDDPDELALMTPVLETALGSKVLAAFHEIDSAMDGSLVAGLQRSDDPLSIALAALIETNTGEPE